MMCQLHLGIDNVVEDDVPIVPRYSQFCRRLCANCTSVSTTVDNVVEDDSITLPRLYTTML